MERDDDKMRRALLWEEDVDEAVEGLELLSSVEDSVGREENSVPSGGTLPVIIVCLSSFSVDDNVPGILKAVERGVGWKVRGLGNYKSHDHVNTGLAFNVL